MGKSLSYHSGRCVSRSCFCQMVVELSHSGEVYPRSLCIMTGCSVSFGICCLYNWALMDDCLSAFMTLVIILLHMFWGIVFFDGCEKRKWYALLVVLLTHLLVSALVSIATLLRLFFETEVHIPKMVDSTLNEIHACGKMRKFRKIV